VRKWLKVTAVLPGTPDDWSVWAERFSRFGLDGTLQTDEPPTMSAYVPPGEAIEGLCPFLVGCGAVVETEHVEEVDWSEAWKQFFKPVAIGRSLWVRPSWEDAATPDGRFEIVLDPGQAFGTGDHPTTRMCLQLLEDIDPAGRRVADIGCGSGILSIAASKLGAASVDAVDTDLQSVEATRENAARNGVEMSAYLGAGFDPLPTGKYDLVLCNVISAAVIGLAPEASMRTDTWIVSGIIGPNWPDVVEAAASVGYEVGVRKEEGDWVAAVLRR
jgi:ribosomal protein L11 methyltransferase